MPHITLPDQLPGITSAFAFRPEIAKPMRELAEVLLRGPNNLTCGERAMTTFVSTRSDCFFCQTSHRTAAARHLDCDYALCDGGRHRHWPPTPPPIPNYMTKWALAWFIEVMSR